MLENAKLHLEVALEHLENRNYDRADEDIRLGTAYALIAIAEALNRLAPRPAQSPTPQTEPAPDDDLAEFRADMEPGRLRLPQ